MIAVTVKKIMLFQFDETSNQMNDKWMWTHIGEEEIDGI